MAQPPALHLTPGPDFSAVAPELRGAAIDIAEAVRDAGGRAMAVGGSVRDLALGATDVSDIDMEVFGVEPDRLERLVGARHPYDACGESFGILKLKGVDIDIAVPRRETKRGTGHKGFLVESDPSLSVSEAATRRDFTINAIYLDPLSGEVEDPCGGLDDLGRGVLRHVSDKFAEDPLRVLRGMQFIARFSLAPAPETTALCRTMDMEGLPPERLFDEWGKLLLKGVRIGDGLRFLRDTGWVRFFPELQALIGCRQDPTWHPEGDVWEHTCLSLDAFARRRIGDPREDLIVGLGVLCHDFGKPSTTKFENGHWRSQGHDEAGAEPTLSFLRRLTREERLLREVPPLVQCHMQPYALWKSNAGDAAIRRLAARVSRIDRLIRVVRADDESRMPDGGADERKSEVLDWLADRAERLRVAAAAPKPILLGRHLIAMGLSPSPEFGKWLHEAYEAQLDGAFTDLDGAIAFFKRQNPLA